MKFRIEIKPDAKGDSNYHNSYVRQIFPEEADEFEREVAVLGRSEKFMSFLKRRSEEKGCVPHTQKEYQEVVEMPDSLTDEVGEDESHPLASFMEILGVLIEKYEDEHIPEITEA